MARTLPCLIILLFACAKASGGSASGPPFSGTIFLDPYIITDADRTAFVSLTAAGTGGRWMFDRRTASFVFLTPFLFNAAYDEGLSIEIQVNPEFGTEAAALVQAERFAPVVGRLPTGLRKDVQTMWIHLGIHAFGGGNNNLLIHTGQATLYENDGILEETFVHEAAHTSLDATHANASDWLAAQIADSEFISTYARDNPLREDVAESYLLYLALRHMRHRISDTLAQAIANTIPNRIAYLDQHPIDLYPLVIPTEIQDFHYNLTLARWEVSWASDLGVTYEVKESENMSNWITSSTIVASGTTTQASLTTTKDRLFYQIVRPTGGP